MINTYQNHGRLLKKLKLFISTLFYHLCKVMDQFVPVRCKPNKSMYTIVSYKHQDTEIPQGPILKYPKALC